MMHATQHRKPIPRPMSVVITPNGVRSLLVSEPHVGETEIEVHLADAVAISRRSDSSLQVLDRGLKIALLLELPAAEEHSLGPELEIERHEVEVHCFGQTGVWILDLVETPAHTVGIQIRQFGPATISAQPS